MMMAGGEEVERRLCVGVRIQKGESGSPRSVIVNE